MADFAVLTIQIRLSAEQHYQVGMHLHISTNGNTWVRDLTPRPEITLPWLDLQQAHLDPDAYGRLLGAALLSSEAARTMLAVARDRANAAGLALHVGLDLDPTDQQLGALHWELLHDSTPDDPLWSASEQLIFSRLLASNIPAKLEPQPGPPRSALLVVASPTDISSFGFKPSDGAGEVKRVRASLQSLDLHVEARGINGAATLGAIVEGLRQQEPDIFLLIAHGRVVDGESYLWLEKEDGQSDRVSATRLTKRIKSLTRLPALIVLVACESAGTSHPDANLRTLGPMLAGIGVPAVLALQGNLSIATNVVLLPTFCRELLRDGVSDRALAVARGAVLDQQDCGCRCSGSACGMIASGRV